MLVAFILVLSCAYVAADVTETLKQNDFEASFEVKYHDLLNDEASTDNEVPWEATIDIFIRNADLNQPLLQAFDNAMTDDEFSSLQNCLRDHPMRHNNVNSDETFAGTTGFLISYKEKGLDRLRNNTSFNCLLPYYERYKLTNTNAWVLNMVWAEVTDYSREFAIKLHTDDGKLRIIK